MAPTPSRAAVRRRERARVAGKGGGVTDPSSAELSSAAVAKRSVGSFSSAFASVLSTTAGTSARRERIGAKVASTCCAMTACGVGPVKGGSPPSIS